MDIFETIRNRRSIRKFTGEPIPREDLEKIVDAGRLAASGSNIQPWEFIAITDPDTLCRLRVPEDHWSEKAGAIIAIVMDPSSRWWIEDGAAAELQAARCIGDTRRLERAGRRDERLPGVRDHRQRHARRCVRSSLQHRRSDRTRESGDAALTAARSPRV